MYGVGIESMEHNEWRLTWADYCRLRTDKHRCSAATCLHGGAAFPRVARAHQVPVLSG